jgi:hypothetical protein
MRSFLLGVVLGCSSCGPLAAVPVTADVIDCVKAEASTDWPTINDKLKPDVGDWSKLATDVIALAPTVALHVAECVGEELIQQALSVKLGVKSTEAASRNSAEAAREQIRAYNQGTSAKKPVYHAQKVCPETANGCNL